MNKKENTILRFKTRINDGKSIKYNDLKLEDASLLYAIERQFGGINKIAKEIGLTEDDLINKYGLTRNINKRTLTEDEIHNRLLYLKSIGKLSTNSMRKEFDDLRLEISIKKLFGSVEKGLKYFNLERDTVRLSKGKLAKEINSLHENGTDMTYTNMLKVNSALLHNATNKFGKGWYSILDELNISYVAIRKKYTKEGILNRINLLKSKFGEINYKIIKNYDASILTYAYNNYESLSDFYLDMNLNPNECMDFSKQTMKGFAFEKLFKQVLDLLSIEYEYNKYFNKVIRPDFQLNKMIWIDCKLSAWTESIETTISKYTPNCNKLIIVFLRGEYCHLPSIDNDKVEFRKIDYYFPFLTQIKRQDLIEEFIKLKNNDFSESVTTERLTS